MMDMNRNHLISSTKSNTVKKIQALLYKRKKREEYGETAVEGPRMVFDLLKDPKTRPLVKLILISTDRWDTYTDEIMTRYALTTTNDGENDDVDTSSSCGDNLQLLQQKQQQPRMIPATPEVMEECTDTVTNQGIIATVRIPEIPIPTETKTVLTNNQVYSAPLYLVVDSVSDPGNLGTLFRSLLATGVVSAVFLLPGSCDAWNPKTIRSSMGAIFHLPIVACMSWKDRKEGLMTFGCTRIVAATMLEVEGNEEATTNYNAFTTARSSTPENSSFPGSLCHYQVDWVAKATALVIGSEGDGLTTDLRKALEKGEIQPVHVPMQPAVESLNAGVAGSVILFEALRQRLRGDVK